MKHHWHCPVFGGGDCACAVLDDTNPIDAAALVAIERALKAGLLVNDNTAERLIRGVAELLALRAAMNPVRLHNIANMLEREADRLTFSRRSVLLAEWRAAAGFLRDLATRAQA